LSLCILPGCKEPLQGTWLKQLQKGAILPGKKDGSISRFIAQKKNEWYEYMNGDWAVYRMKNGHGKEQYQYSGVQ